MITYREFLKRVLTVFAIGIFCLALWHLRNVVMLAFLSSIIAVSLTIPVQKLQVYGVKRGHAITGTVVGIFVLIVLFFVWVMPVMASQMIDLFAELPDAYNQAVIEYTDWRGRQTSEIRTILPDFKTEGFQRDLRLGSDNQIFSADDLADFAIPLLGSAGSVILGVFANLVIVIIISIFFLIDPLVYIRGLMILVPTHYQQRTLEVLIELRKTLVAWMTALSLSITVTIFLVWLIIGIILGIPNALALGVVAGFATIIPNIGSIIPLIPITIFTLADNPSRLPFVLIAYLIIQQLESNVITPIFVKRQLALPAAVVFLFQIISASLFGFLGILLAIPLLATIITLVRELYVYDVLGLRGIRVDIETGTDGKLSLVKKASGPPLQIEPPHS